MKICTITCHRVYNHGALLQAWALATYLRSLKHDVRIIDYRPIEFFKRSVGNPRYDKPLLRWIYLALKYPAWKKSLSRKGAFDLFYDQYMSQMTTDLVYKKYADLKIAAPKADVYIAGSDQIWNTNLINGRDPAFYLAFGDENSTRLSYAASFATKEIADGWNGFVKEQLSHFDAISVRENTGVDIAKTLGYCATKVIDPVFLLSKEIWDKSFESRKGEGESYILVYDFEHNKDIEECAVRLSRLLKVKIYSVGPGKLKYADKNFVNNGPDDFVSLIKYSKCVLSNSFHGSVFSMIFNRDFFVINRTDGLNTRMLELLSTYNLSTRLIDRTATDEVLLAHIDYSSVNPLMENDIRLSKKWLNIHLK